PACSICIIIDVPDLGRPDTITTGRPYRSRRRIRTRTPMSGFSLGYTERLLEMTIDPHGYSRPQPQHVDPTWSPGRPAAILATLIVLTLVAAQPADAYVGPGAGFALLSSFLVLFTTLVAALASLLFWPFRMLWRRLRGGAPPRARIRRLVIVGFD